MRIMSKNKEMRLKEWKLFKIQFKPYILNNFGNAKLYIHYRC